VAPWTAATGGGPTGGDGTDRSAGPDVRRAG